MKTKLITPLVFFLLLAFNGQAIAQEEGSASGVDEAPQILTSDLVRKQVILEPEKIITFVIVDSDTVTDVTINDKPVDIDPGETVVIKKRYIFQPGRTVLRITATDEQGNRSERSFLVGLQEDSMAEEANKDAAAKKEGAAKKKGGISFSVNLGAAYEIDDNPTNDLSSPISIGDEEITGVVDDGDQPDNKTTLKATVSMKWGGLSLFLGGVQSDYAKEENDGLDSLVTFLGANYKLDFTKGFAVLLGLVASDVNVGGYDYVQSQSFSPGMLFSSSNKEDGTTTHLLGATFVSKEFSSADKEAGSGSTFKWERNNMDADNLDSLKSVFFYGTASEGTEESEYTVVGMDFDWKNKWRSGFKWDLGFGMHYLDYQNQTPLSDELLGATRIDLPIRIYNGFGWEFSKYLSLLLDYKYKFNLSNKTPYVRTITGIRLNGSF